VRVLGLPLADFSVAVSTDTVRFTNMSTGAQDYLWRFGDGGERMEESPVWVYGSPGTYPVTLIVSNTCGQVEVTRNVVLSGALPEADFVVDTVLGCAPLALTFTDRSAGDIRFRAWTFTGGSPTTAGTEEVLVTYAEAGVYPVRLEVGNFYGRDTLTRNAYVVVLGAPEIEQWEINSGRPEDPAWLQYTFEATASGAGLTYEWQVLGLDTLSGASQTYTFPGPGIYQVRLVVRNSCGVVEEERELNIIISSVRDAKKGRSWQVYPNPSDGMIQIKSEGPMRLRLFDVLGRLVWQGTVSGPAQPIDLRGLSGGTYWLQGQVGEQLDYVRLIIR
jgi:PKD repeat protein